MKTLILVNIETTIILMIIYEFETSAIPRNFFSQKVKNYNVQIEYVQIMFLQFLWNIYSWIHFIYYLLPFYINYYLRLEIVRPKNRN